MDLAENLPEQKDGSCGSWCQESLRVDRSGDSCYKEGGSQMKGLHFYGTHLLQARDVLRGFPLDNLVPGEAT